MRERLKKTMPSKAHHEILTAVGSICTQNLLLPIALVITVVGAVVTALVPPLILEKIVDGLTAGNPMPIAQAFSYFGVVALAGLLESTRESLLIVFGQKLTHGLRSQMCGKLSQLSADTLSKMDAGTIASRFVGDVDTLETLFTSGIISMFADACTMIGIYAVLWQKNRGLAITLLAVLPLVGGSNMQLMKAESPGPSVGKLVPKVRFTARILYVLYVALTVLQVLVMLLGGMTFYEALCTSFGTAGTGGFGIYGDSIAGFSPFLQWAITIFMIAFGVNFNVYFLLYMRRPKDALHCEEMHWYLGIIVAAALMICANAYDVAMTLEGNLRQSFFQVASIITTTGFATTDFNLWPGFSHGILVVLMFVGACAGSTGGGFKVSRIVIGFKSVLAYLGAFLHPRVVRKVKFEDKDVDGETMRAISAYFTAAISLFTISVLLVALDGFDLVTTFSAVAATFNNVGPGLGVAGPTSNFAAFSDFSKVVMTMDMLLGRLEVFPMLMLFYPPLWKESIGEARIRRNRSPFH